MARAVHSHRVKSSSRPNCFSAATQKWLSLKAVPRAYNLQSLAFVEQTPKNACLLACTMLLLVFNQAAAFSPSSVHPGTDTSIFRRVQDGKQLLHMLPVSHLRFPSLARTCDFRMGPLPAAVSSLPISPLLPGIVEALCSSDNLVLQAPPGAGKTTAVPLALLDEKSFGSILVLEPRRIAARSAASRMASLLGEKLGQRIGYRVKRDGASSAQTKVLVVTEGILVRRLQRDPGLKGVDLVIFDEFHERSIDADLCLALCRRAQLSAQKHGGQGPKLLVMSATLGDTSALQDLLGGSEAITSEGRSFPVTIKYVNSQPLFALAASKPWEIAETVAEVVKMALNNADGDALVFLPGEGEIRTAERWLLNNLDARTRDGLSVMPLYGALDPMQQRLAIEPDPNGKRRVILATPIAESSLTIEGVRIVVDSGLRKILAYDPVTGMSGLRTVPISLASATQRTGRAGRVTSGTAYRLWSESDEEDLANQTSPEILQADLTQLALELASVGVSTAEMVAELPWLTPPPADALTTAHELLLALGALRKVPDGVEGSDGVRLESTGYAKRLSRLPLHPRLAHMLLASAGNGMLEKEATLLAALLTERDIMSGNSRQHGSDVRLRLSMLEEAAPPEKANGAAWSRVKKEAAELLRDLNRLTQRRDGGAPDDDPDGDDDEISGGDFDFTPVRLAAAVGGRRQEGAGALLALAFPDRVAQLQKGKENSYTLYNGRAATLPFKSDPLLRSEYLVAPEIQTSDTRAARMQLCAPISAEALRTALGPALEEKDEVFLAPSDGSVRARHSVRLGCLVLQSDSLPSPPADMVAPLLLDQLRKQGLGSTLFKPTDDRCQAARELVARVALLRTLHGPDAGWPTWSEESLLADAELWLEPALREARGLKDIQKSNIAAMLKKTLDGMQLAMLEQQAPTTVELPSGNIGQLRYARANENVLWERDADCQGAPPVKPIVSSKLQEWFGQSDLPKVGGPPGETLEVQLNLLSPSGKQTPMAMVSGSLSDFWKSDYEEVRIAGKARYPKHPWPEDPISAEPTRLSKKALAKQAAGTAGSSAANKGSPAKKGGKPKKGKGKSKKKR